jgi:KamA family protein
MKQQLKIFTERNFKTIQQIKVLSEEQYHVIKTVAQVLPFRVNCHVVNELIDWNNIPEDPMFQLLFPQPGMLAPNDFNAMSTLIRNNNDKQTILKLANSIRARLNPHPSQQLQLNRPVVNNSALEGIQHKYTQTVLFFPARGQTCHSYCTFCFRWAQFIGDKELKFACNDINVLTNYLQDHPEVSDVIFTGGDPMIMNTKFLAEYTSPLLNSKLTHVKNIRFGTKSLTFWPQRFVTDPDADDLLRLLESLVKAGKQVAIMSHFNHWCELEPKLTRQAIQRIQSTGAIIRSQGPVLKHINDNATIWERMWKTQVQLGIIPYYMFVERDTGPKSYFELPLVQTLDIYRSAIQNISGLGRTVRGPSMSTTPGKVEIQDVKEINGEKVIVLRFLQCRNPLWSHRVFFAKFDPEATWLDQLVPAFGEKDLFDLL